MATSIPTTIATATNTSLIFMAFIPLLQPTGSRTDDPLVLGSGLLISLLSKSSSVSSTSPSAI